MLILIIMIIGFIFLSGLLALIDAAILSVSPAEVHAMEKQQKHGAAALVYLRENISRAVVVVVILTNTVNVLGPILVGQKAVALFGNTAIGVITAILTFGTIIFSEIIPKSLGAHYAPTISRLSAPFIKLLVHAGFFIVIPLNAMADFFQRGERKIGTEDQIRSLVTMGREEGHIERDEGQLIHRAFILNDKTAHDIMTPLKNMVTFTDDMTIRDAAEVVFKESFSRFPVYRTSLHEIGGLAISKDVLEAMANGQDSKPLSTITRPGLVVDSNMRADELLVLFRDEHIHLAVVQENGKTAGLVTLEDVLEELVGEIDDEKDMDDANEKRQD